MFELRFDDPCLLFALGRESGPFLRTFPPTQRFPGAPCRSHFCGPSWLTVLALETGVGQSATQRALEWLETEPNFDDVAYKPKLILSAGFAGSLHEGLRVGDLVLATEIADEGGLVAPTTWPCELQGHWYPPLKRGRILSLPRLVGEPEEKRRLGSAHEALAVDMESAALARWCRHRDVPFGSVRVITDEVDVRLSPELLSMVDGGRVSCWRMLKSVARRPSLVKELLRLRRDTNLAAEQLGLALGELLTLTLSWFDPEEIDEARQTDIQRLQ
ncbi:MAG: hypothetical protein L0Y72_19375 [Gemmataceae bacterium]|nr:hypothetical protein [Gemmataceae bacterium]MCI0741197.1 hypothetical protein [Gemmataceae bacterium]